MITDKFDGTVPRERKLVSLVVDDDVQPKPVDVTVKQEQARAVADASFESSYKAPEKRQETELMDGSNKKTTPEPIIATDREAAKNADIKTEQDNLSSTVTKALETQSEKVNTQTSVPKDEFNNATNKGVISDNSTATSKTKVSSNTNGSGSAPKTKSGSLDPNRLPDSSGDNINNANDSSSNKK